MKRKDEIRVWPWAVALALAMVLLIPQGVFAAGRGDASISSSIRTAAPWLVAQQRGGEGAGPETREMGPQSPAEESRRGAQETSPPVETQVPQVVEPQIAPEGVRGAAPSPTPEEVRAIPPVETQVPQLVEPHIAPEGTRGASPATIPEEMRRTGPSREKGITVTSPGVSPGASPGGAEGLLELKPPAATTPQQKPPLPGKITGPVPILPPVTTAGPTPVVRLYESLRPVPADPTALPPVVTIPPPGSDKMMEGLRRDMAQNQPLVEAFARHGAPPTPEGAGRIVGLAERFPDEFRGLAARTARASENPEALGEVEEALRAFFSKGTVAPREWEELGYVVARLIQEDRASASSKGQPLFQKPLLFNRGAEPPKGRDDGKGTEEWFKDLPGGDPSGKSIPGFKDLDKTLEGQGKGVSWGDGIQGITDQEGKPDAGLPDPGGVPQIPLRDPLAQGTDPGVGGAKEPYGGLNINLARLGQLYGGGKKKKKTGGSKSKPKWIITGKVTHIPKPGPPSDKGKGKTKGKKGGKTGGTTGDKSKSQDSSGKTTETWYSPNMRKTTYPSGDYIWSYRLGNGNVLHIEHDKNGNLTGVITHFKKGSGGGKVGPEGEGGDTPPVHEPQLLMQATKEAEESQPYEDEPGLVTDPMPVKEVVSAEAGPSGGESPTRGTGPSGAAGTEQKWKFAGKKPGSEVTDPPEWGCPGCEGDVAIKYDLSQVTDPLEPGSAPAGKEAAASPALMRQQAASALAPIFARLLVSSVQAAGETQQSSQATQADAETAGDAPQGPEPEAPPQGGGGGQ